MPASVALLSAAGLECLYDGNEVMARGNATLVLQAVTNFLAVGCERVTFVIGSPFLPKMG